MNINSDAFKAKKEAVEKVKGKMKKYLEKYGGPGSGRHPEGGSDESNSKENLTKEMDGIDKEMDKVLEAHGKEKDPDKKKELQKKHNALQEKRNLVWKELKGKK